MVTIHELEPFPLGGSIDFIGKDGCHITGITDDGGMNGSNLWQIFLNPICLNLKAIKVFVDLFMD
jgi:hypothetical protein